MAATLMLWWVTKYAAKGKTVTIVGMNDDSAARHERLAGNLGAGS